MKVIKLFLQAKVIFGITLVQNLTEIKVFAFSQSDQKNLIIH